MKKNQLSTALSQYFMWCAIWKKHSIINLKKNYSPISITVHVTQQIRYYTWHGYIWMYFFYFKYITLLYLNRKKKQQLCIIFKKRTRGGFGLSFYNKCFCEWNPHIIWIWAMIDCYVTQFIIIIVWLLGVFVKKLLVIQTLINDFQ